MPTVGEFHTFYWEFSDSLAAPVAKPGQGGYPVWQAGVISPSLLGGLQGWYERWAARIRFAWRLMRRVDRLDRERRAVVLRTLDLLESHGYTHARQYVKSCAQTLGFNKPDAWTTLKRGLKDEQGEAENLFRHLHVVRQLRTGSGSTYSNPTAHLLTELAYHGFTIRPRA